MSLFDAITAWSATVETGSPMPSGQLSMVIGVYVGLALGTMDPAFGAQLRQQLEREMGDAMGTPPEQLEAIIRGLIEARR